MAAPDIDIHRPSQEIIDRANAMDDLIARQNRWRGTQTINLIASETTPSRRVRKAGMSDFVGRYAEGHPNTPTEQRRYYRGSKYIDIGETWVEDGWRELAHCRQVDDRPISGNNSNSAIALGFLRAGDPYIANEKSAGGHISHGAGGVFGRRVQVRGMTLNPGRKNSIPLHLFPQTPDGYHIDVPRTTELIEKVEPKLLILGRSLFLFPEPVAEIAEVCRNRKEPIPILYDAAHVLGLIVGGQFQDPLREGATWMSASTHKTLFGPQRGVVLANLSDEDAAQYWPSVDKGVLPGTSSNHHLATLIGSYYAILEMLAFGHEYAAAVVKGAQVLAQTLDECGISVEAKEFGYTMSHQVAINVTEFGGGDEVARILEEQDIIVNSNMLPGDNPSKASGLRLGVQEMVRFGMGPEALRETGQLMADGIRGKKVKPAVHRLRRGYTRMLYTLDSYTRAA